MSGLAITHVSLSGNRIQEAAEQLSLLEREIAIAKLLFQCPHCA